MTKKVKTRKHIQSVHFYRRMIERFNIFIKKHELENLKKQITIGTSVFIGKSSNRVSLHGVKFNEIWLVVIYDKIRNELVTVKPKTDLAYKVLEKKINEKNM